MLLLDLQIHRLLGELGIVAREWAWLLLPLAEGLLHITANGADSFLALSDRGVLFLVRDVGGANDVLHVGGTVRLPEDLFLPLVLRLLSFLLDHVLFSEGIIIGR